MIEMCAFVVPPRKKLCGRLYKKTGAIFHKIQSTKLIARMPRLVKKVLNARNGSLTKNLFKI
jgi:hypothetical protein